MGKVLNITSNYFLFTECQDLIAKCLRIEASQRILLEDVLRHPWMKLENNGGSSSTTGINSSTLSHAPSVMANSINSPTTVNNSAENQHKPSLNSVGSCVSSSTDEDGCSSESPQHKISRPQVLPQYTVSFSNWLYTANAYRQTTDKLMFKSVISTVR